MPGSYTAVPGQELSVAGDGFAAGARVQATLFSTPVVLGTESADGTGYVQLLATIPRDTPTGQHEIRLVGRSPSGGTRTDTMSLTISLRPRSLPTTGYAAARQVAFALMLAAAGGALMTAAQRLSRRRQIL
jgi:hypothetical protein